MVDTSSSFKMIQLMTGFWLSRAIYVAAKLGIADLINEEPKDLGELAKATGSHEPSLYRVLRALASAGIFAEDERGKFALTPLAATLRTDVPGSLRAWVNMQSGDEQFRAWGDLLHSVKTGETAFNHVFGMSVWQYRAQNPEQAKSFDDAMSNQTAMYNTAVLSSYSFSRFEKIVDVGGGDGSLLTTILESNPALKGVVFDLPHVAEKAKQRIDRAGLTERCQVIVGDVFASVPEGGDAYILSRMIQSWDDTRAVEILKNCGRAMVPNGRILIIEGVIHSRNESDINKMFDLTMMALSGGRQRTAIEYQKLLEAAGFTLSQIIPTESVMDVSVIECRRAQTLDVAPEIG
jgi:ubiquinone/menaquinone biosynthesis C-methylase UbiE